MSNFRNALLGWAITIGLLAAAVSWLADVITHAWPVLLAVAGTVVVILLVAAFLRHRWMQRW